MNITAETRRESYGRIKPIAQKRRDAILEILSNGEMTASEIAETLYSKGIVPFCERNFASPRLTELKAAGRIKTVGKKYCDKTGRKVALWRVVS